VGARLAMRIWAIKKARVREWAGPAQEARQYIIYYVRQKGNMNRSFHLRFCVAFVFLALRRQISVARVAGDLPVAKGTTRTERAAVACVRAAVPGACTPSQCYICGNEQSRRIAQEFEPLKKIFFSLLLLFHSGWTSLSPQLMSSQCWTCGTSFPVSAPCLALQS
jgi:hypothetical protein